MRHFDTLIRADTLTLRQAPGLNLRILMQEVRTRDDSSCTRQREDKHLI